MARRSEDSPARASECRLLLTDRFELVMFGQRVRLPHSVERVVAYLGLSPQPIHRAKLAGTLWPDAPDALAARSLRTALWRLNRGAASVLDVREDRVALLPTIGVDIIELFHLTRKVLGSPTTDALNDLDRLVDSSELLPGWDDEWVVSDRERFRMLRLEALERGAERLIERADHGRAMEAALAAATSDPFRDSAQRLVVRIHLSEGNLASALRAYDEYRMLLDHEIGVEPSPAMQSLIRPYQHLPTGHA